jgi:muramoyltetrapeptide carboxypeptidase
MLRHFAATVWEAQDSETVACAHGYPPGAIGGTLWGGNLSLLSHLAGTPYLPAIDGGLLYVEEIAEDPYAVERQFLQLQHAGILPRQAAIILGDFSRCVPDNPARYPYAMDEVVETLRAIAPGPVLTGLPFGHVAKKLTLPFGVPGILTLGRDEYALSWPGLGAT